MGDSLPDGAARAATAAERIDVLDALRGLALWGILFANILIFSGWEFIPPDGQQQLGGLVASETVNLIHYGLIDGKFYTLFSLLFGIGFALQLHRLEARGADGVRIFRRRLVVLLGFGLVHLVLLWLGDILTLYALLGLLLPFVRHWSERRLLWGAILLLLVPIPSAALFEALAFDPFAVAMPISGSIAAMFHHPLTSPLAWQSETGLGSLLAYNLSGPPIRVAMLIENWRIPKVLGIMMLGMLLGRRLVAGTLLGDRRLLWRTLTWGLIVGLPLSAWCALAGFGQDSVQAVIGTAPLAFAYAAGFVLVWPRARRGLGLLVAPGRLALTNYLMQTLLCIVIFYGVGLGLGGKVGPGTIWLIGAAIFAAQILASNLWLRHFDQGPMEALWRRLTYGRRSRPAVAIEPGAAPA